MEVRKQYTIINNNEEITEEEKEILEKTKSKKRVKIFGKAK